MKQPERISQEQAVEILSGPRDIPPNIVQEIGERIEARKPLVNPNAFNEFAEAHVERPRKPNIQEVASDTMTAIVKLGSTSVYMAHMLGADVGIPRPRRLGEHNQSVTNVYEYVFGRDFAQRGDDFLRLFGTVFQDGGKSYANAVDGHARGQKVHNYAVLRNILPYTEVLTQDQKRVMELVLVRDMVGRALYRYNDQQHLFEDVVAEAEQEMNALRQELPERYRAKADKMVDALYRADAGAHTQHPAARYIDPKTGKTYRDVTNQNRRTLSKNGNPTTLDRIFSEAPSDRDKLRFHRPKDLRILERLLPSLYGKQD